MIHLTHLPAPTSPADAVSAILAYDAERPDGLTKEVIARCAALTLLKVPDGVAALVELHDLLDPTVTAAVASSTGIVNPVVKRLVFVDALHVPPGQQESDVTADLAGAIYDVFHNKPLTVTAITAPPIAGGLTSPLFGSSAVATPPADLSGIDLLSPECEPLRIVLTRTLMNLRPDAYAAYRQIKDSGAPNARENAYGYVFGLLAKLIAETRAQGGF